MLDNNIGDFSPPAACMASTDTVLTSQQGGRFHVTSSLVFLCLETEICHVISNAGYGGNQAQ